MISRFFVLSGAVLGMSPVKLLIRIWMIAAVLSLSVAAVVAAFPEAIVNMTTDTFESTILKYGTLEEVEMLREIRQEGSR